MHDSIAQVITNPVHAAVVREVFAADAARDAKRFAAIFTEDGVFQLGGTPSRQGHEAILASVAGFFASPWLAGMEHRLIEAWTAPETLVYQAEVTYSLSQGGQVTLPYTNVLRFAANRVRDYRVYIDLSPMAAASSGSHAATPPAPAVHISPDNESLPVLIVFDVEPERQGDLIAEIRRFIDIVVRHQPGFVSSSIHASEDGRRVFNYGQWQDRAAYERFLSNRLPQEGTDVFLGVPFDSRPYRLVFQVIHPAASSAQ